MIKKIILMFVLLFSSIIGIAYAAADLQIVVDQITPLPVEPGEDMTVKVRIVNNGEIGVDDISVERVYDFPFRLEYELQEDVKVGYLGAGASKEITFYVSVSPKAKTGVYPITFNIHEGVTSKKQNILINIVGKPEVLFTVNSISENITPGKSFDVNLKILNIGTGNARNVKISSNLDNFAFKDSSVFYIDNLKSAEAKNISLNMLVDSSVNAGLYQIPFEVEMIGENGQKYVSSQKLNINIIESAEVTLKDLKIKPMGQVVGSPINVEVRVENIGVGNADNVYVELKFDNSTSNVITGSKKAYIGHLEKTDESPAFFTLNSQKAGKYVGKILIHYSDDLGEHVTTETLNLTYKEDTSINYTLYGLVICALILVILVFRKFKK